MHLRGRLFWLCQSDKELFLVFGFSTLRAENRTQKIGSANLQGIANLGRIISCQPAFWAHTNHDLLSTADRVRALGNIRIAGVDAKVPVCQWPRITFEVNCLDRCNWPFNADILVGPLFGLRTQAKAASPLE
jgi:hypothetical protein